MSSSHTRLARPSPILALVCLSVVQRLHPEWIAVPLGQAAREHDVSPQHLSRLCSRAIRRFEAVMATLTRRGRPPVDSEASEAATELALTRALLGVATSILEQVSLRKQAVRALVVGAFERLEAEHRGLTCARFTRALGISERTFRYWRRQARETHPSDTPVEEAPSAPRKPRARPPRRPRCGFDVTLPGTQYAADTTDLRVFDVPLKLMAAQDVGGRDTDLLDGVVVDDHESAELIAGALVQALAGREGAQIITDQGTPYMAKSLSEAMDGLSAEHAPQREGTPTDKPTIEKAFDTVKSIAGPLFELTNRLGQVVPELADPAIATSSARLVIIMLLRAYQAGARATRRALEARGSTDPEELARLAEESRERARKHDQSVRLRLQHIHELYNLPRSVTAFVRTFRRYPLAVIEAAERGFREQAHRGDIRDRWSYFAAVVRRCNDHHQQELARRQSDEQARLERRQQEAVREAEVRRHHADPASWLRDTLDYIMATWNPALGRFGFGNGTFGLGRLRSAVTRLVEIHGATAARDIARGVLANFVAQSPQRLGAGGVETVTAILESHLPADPGPPTPSQLAYDLAAATLHLTGSEPRPGTSPPLRTLPARAVGS
jgi:hypothetical protein